MKKIKKFFVGLVICLGLVIGCAGLNKVATDCNYTDCSYTCIADEYPMLAKMAGMPKLGDYVRDGEQCTYINLAEWRAPDKITTTLDGVDRVWFVYIDTDAIDHDLNGEPDMGMVMVKFTDTRDVAPEVRGRIVVFQVGPVEMVAAWAKATQNKFGVTVEFVWAKEINIPNGWTPCKEC